MLKMMATVTRRATVTHGDLLRFWEEVHAPFIAKNIEPARYKITFFEAADAFPHPGTDGMAEMWFRDEAHFKSLTADEIGRDGFGNYADLAAIKWYPVTEYVNVEKAATEQTVKLVYFLRRQQGVPLEEFHRSWLDVHLPNVKAAVERSVEGLRYTVNLINSPEELDYDGVAQIWMASENPTIADLAIERDSFGDLIGILHGCQSRELVIVA